LQQDAANPKSALFRIWKKLRMLHMGRVLSGRGAVNSGHCAGHGQMFAWQFQPQVVEFADADFAISGSAPQL
jgi:hypothetical protein